MELLIAEDLLLLLLDDERGTLSTSYERPLLGGALLLELSLGGQVEMERTRILRTAKARATSSGATGMLAEEAASSSSKAPVGCPRSVHSAFCDWRRPISSCGIVARVLSRRVRACDTSSSEVAPLRKRESAMRKPSSWSVTF